MFVMYTVGFGLVWMFLIPPLQTPDELNHLCRAYQLSEGRCRGRNNEQEEKQGDYLPRSIALLATRVGLSRIRFHPDEKLNPDHYVDAFAIPTRHSERVFVEFENTLRYAPTAYVPQIIAIWLGRALNLPIVVTLLLTRLFALCTSTLLLYIALRQIPFLQAHICLLLLMPMTLQQLLCPGTDALLLSCGVLFLALVLRAWFRARPQSIKWADLVVFAGLGLVIGTAKVVYLPICLSLLLIPSDRFVCRRLQVIGAGAVLSLIFAVSLGWFVFAIQGEGSAAGGSSLAFLCRHPFFTVRSVTVNILVNLTNPHTYDMIYGRLGWLDTHIPPVFGFLHALALAATLVLAPRAKRSTALWRPAVLLVLGAMALGAISLVLMLVANRRIYVIQGRYYLALLPLLSVPTHLVLSRWERLKAREWPVPQAACWLVGGISLLGATFAVLKRYYL